jgi:predicted MFS family arabinose efflux permease
VVFRINLVNQRRKDPDRKPQAASLLEEAWLLRLPGVATVVIASFAARLPIAMVGLATLFFVQAEADSAALAGLTLGAFSLTAALLAPLRGRLVDRRGVQAGLFPLALAHAATTVGLLPAAQLPGSEVLLIAVSALGGATAPPVNATMRALWPTLVPRERLDGAYSLEAVLQEATYIAGPLLTGLLVSIFSPQAPLIVAAILVAVGGLLFCSHRAAVKLGPAKTPAKVSLRSAGVRTLLAAVALAAVALGALEVAVSLFGEGEGSPASGGLLVALISGASLLGGAWYGTRRWSAPPSSRFIAASAIGAIGCALTIPAGSTLALAAGVVVFGATLAPSLAAVYSILDDVVPEGAAVEAVTWMTTATASGAAVGAFAAGVAIERASFSAALALAAGAMIVATAVALVWRDRLASAAVAPAASTLKAPELSE